jgi:phosphoglycolate phosphatase
VRVRAVAVDIDGTMTDYDRLLDFEGVRAIRAVERKGIPVIAATGNVGPVTKGFCDYVGTSGPAVCENGGVVYDRTFKQRHVLATRRHADRAARHLARRGFDVRYIASDPWRVSEVALELNLDVDEVKRELAHWRLTIVSTRFALHLMDTQLDKVNGLKVALRHLKGVRPEHVLAIGDSNNDEGLMRGCGASGAPSNCTPRIREAAGFVARGPHGRGVRQVLEHYGVL